jgi:hypothetical protein
MSEWGLSMYRTGPYGAQLFFGDFGGVIHAGGQFAAFFGFYFFLIP